ncbi:XF1762 family protein [Kitasatospora sp. NPDC048540]|uniref:XF1762 family protein n=1 Tax=Kitasatospora sp. NPDC048540 TaxID=3155634 RepID=UPI0033C9CDEA
MSLHLVPVRSREAKAFVLRHHRHHRPPAGQVFALGAADGSGVLRAVAIVGRPVARHLDDGVTLEVTRTCSDGVRNANSLLYGAAWRAAKALGYARLVTYTQEGETGASLRGAGWRVVAQRRPRAGWDTPRRRRTAGGAAFTARTLWQAPWQSPDGAAAHDASVDEAAEGTGGNGSEPTPVAGHPGGGA